MSGFQRLEVGHLPARLLQPCQQLIQKVYEQAGREAPTDNWGHGSWWGQANVSYKAGMAWNVWINIAEGDGDGMGASHAFSVDAANRRFKRRGGAYERLSTHDHDAFLDELIAYMHSPQLAADERRREQQEADEDAMYAAMEAYRDEYEADEHEEEEEEEFDPESFEWPSGAHPEGVVEDVEDDDDDAAEGDGQEQDEEDEEDEEREAAAEQASEPAAAAAQEDKGNADDTNEEGGSALDAAAQPGQEEPASKRRKV